MFVEAPCRFFRPYSTTLPGAHHLSGALGAAAPADRVPSFGYLDELEYIDLAFSGFDAPDEVVRAIALLGEFPLTQFVAEAAPTFRLQTNLSYTASYAGIVTGKCSNDRSAGIARCSDITVTLKSLTMLNSRDNVGLLLQEAGR